MGVLDSAQQVAGSRSSLFEAVLACQGVNYRGRDSYSWNGSDWGYHGGDNVKKVKRQRVLSTARSSMYAVRLQGDKVKVTDQDLVIVLQQQLMD